MQNAIVTGHHTRGIKTSPHNITKRRVATQSKLVVMVVWSLTSALRHFQSFANLVQFNHIMRFDITFHRSFPNTYSLFFHGVLQHCQYCRTLKKLLTKAFIQSSPLYCCAYNNYTYCNHRGRTGRQTSCILCAKSRLQ